MLHTDSELFAEQLSDIHGLAYGVESLDRPFPS